MGAEYLFYMKSIETHARAFLALIILGIGTVWRTSLYLNLFHWPMGKILVMVMGFVGTFELVQATLSEHPNSAQVLSMSNLESAVINLESWNQY